MRLSRPRRLALAALALLPVAAAADWRYVDASAANAPVDIVRLLPHGDALLSFSADGVWRTDAQGQSLRLRRSDPLGTIPGESITGGIVSDANTVLLTTQTLLGVNTYCTLQAVDLDGRASWRLNEGTLDGRCRPVFSNGTGVAWVPRRETAHAIDRHGRFGGIARTGSLSELGQFGDQAVVLPDGGLIASWNSLTPVSDPDKARLSRYTPSGSPVWTWRHDSKAQVQHLLDLGDGAVLGALEDRDGDDDHAVLRWNADGSVAWRLAPPVYGSRVTALLAAAQGDFYALFGGTAQQPSLRRVLRLSGAGQIRWQRELSCADTGAAVAALTPDDGLAYACSSDGTATLLRVDPAGTASTALPLPLGKVAQLLRDYGGLLAVGTERAPSTRQRVLRIVGDTVVPAAVDALRSTRPRQGHASLFAADGSSYLALADADDASGAGQKLTALDPQGRQRWAQPLPFDGRLRAALSEAAGRVCTAGTLASTTPASLALLCLDASSGEPLWQQPLSGDDVLALRALDGGDIIVVGSGSDGYSVRRFVSGGAPLVSAGGERRGQAAAIDALGTVTVVTDIALSQFAADGRRRLHIDGASLPLQFNVTGFDGTRPVTRIAAADDGSVWVGGIPKGAPWARRAVWAIAPNGSTRWVSDIDAKPGLEMFATPDSLYVTQWGEYATTVAAAQSESSVSRLIRSDGSVRWRYRSYDWQPRTNAFAAADAPGSPALALSTDGGALLLAHSRLDRLRLQRLDVASGRLLHERFVACAAACAPPYAIAADRNADLRLSLDLFDADAGNSAGIIALDGAAAAPTSVRLDQAGIGGAWWAPFAHGEGITFDWLADSRTLFGAWFTFTLVPEDGPRGLRWFTLQANHVSAGARRIELAILSTEGGNFAAAPAVAPQQAGTAIIDFHDCNNATLQYDFDGLYYSGRQSTVTLSRLSPATAPCVLGDGSTQPAAGARPPQQGFDARMSGTWFDPALPGQGLQFSVQPGGVFFAPWFTFDPAGSPNDTARQHWFTLQGDLAQASGGSVELQLVQTTGGAFERMPTSNAYVVGWARLQMLACDRARLDYRFGAAVDAQDFAGLGGSLSLEKAGGCAAP